MKQFTFLICFIYIVSGAFSQAFETVGAGVIDFLISNPKTANRMNSTDKAALNVIGNLLYTAGKRKHDMNVANAGRQQIILQETSGKQVTFVIDPSGKHYILYQGIIYPIENQIIKQAEEEFVPKYQVKNEYLPPYNLSDIKNSFHFSELKKHSTRDTIIYVVKSKDGEDIHKIAQQHRVDVDDMILLTWGRIKIRSFTKKQVDKGLKKMKEENVKAKMHTTFEIKIRHDSLESCMPFIFTCNWVKDFDKDGLEFDDFQGVKNSFSKKEKILFVVGYQTEENDCTYSFEIYESATGNLFFRREGYALPGKNIIQEEVTTDALIPGGYVFNYTLQKEKETIASNQERFEIRGE